MSTVQEMTYSQAMDELEKIVAKIQGNDCEIDDLKGYTTKALELLRFCKTKLFETDEELKKILSEMEV